MIQKCYWGEICSLEFSIYIYLFIELEKVFFKPTFWPSWQYFRARRVLRSGCSIKKKTQILIEIQISVVLGHK